MTEIGRASASQVIAAYRHDFVLRKAGIRWPEPPQVAPNDLPVARLAALVSAKRPVFYPLEAVWTLYEMTSDDMLALRSMWGDVPYAWTVRELIGRIANGMYTLPPENTPHLDNLETLARQGALPAGQYVAVEANAMDMRVPVGSRTMCLVDGHHRLVASARSGTLPKVCRVFVGSRPVPLDVAVLNGTPGP